MDILKKITDKFGKIPTYITYNDLSQILGKVSNSIFTIENDVLDYAETLAKNSPRKRFLILLHNSLEETAHRMINTLVKGTYAQPHTHTDPNTSEEFTALRGSACILEFSESGEIINRLPFGDGYDTNLVEIKPNSIHSIIPLTETVTLFEVKGQTNYDPSKDKSFYPWAPKERDNPEGIKRYLKTFEENQS